jgi:hypothetical protein
MLRIYVSSTYSDLVEERRAAKDAIFSLGHFPVGMEEYAASDERPLDRCLSDVRSCQGYVGIIAWKYGFRPGGGEKSITQLEYEEALEHRIPVIYSCFTTMRRGPVHACRTKTNLEPRHFARGSVHSDWSATF